MDPVTGKRTTAQDAGMPARVDSADRVLNAIRDHAIVALDEAGIIALWSAGAAALTGYSEDEAVGREFSMFGAQDSAADLTRMLNGARADGSIEQDRWWRRRDGGLIWVHQTLNPIDGGGFVIVARDRTARADEEERRLAGEREEAGLDRERRLRAELQAAERRAAFLAEASSILVATSLDFESTLRALVRLTVSRLADWCVIHAFDEAGQLVPSAQAHRDPRTDEALERSVHAMLTRQWQTTLDSVASTGQSQILERRVVRSWFDGDSASAEAAAEVGTGTAIITPLMGRGRVLGAITIMSTDADREYDDEDLALAEELGRRAAIALDNARLYRDAQEANRAKADFLAVISHELRTPLNAIMGYSDLLDAGISGELSDRQGRQVGRIRASARHLLQLIEEILSFARIEAGGDEVRLGLTDAGELAAEAAAVIEPMAEAKHLEFRLDIEDEHVTIETDAGKARQVLVNLLSNAVKFTDRGSVTLRFRREGERAVYEVVDTGVGIPAEQVDRIFDPFWQVERPNTRRAGGTGLGLSVSRRFTRLLRGELAVNSEPGRGTTFSLSLPLRLTGATPVD